MIRELERLHSAWRPRARRVPAERTDERRSGWELATTDVEASKIKGDKKFTIALDVTNNAFRIFYDARQLISRVSDFKVKRAMTADLDDVGRTGWGLGVDDLEEAFKHLADNSGKWKDDKSSTMG